MAADFDEDLRTVLRRSGCKVGLKVLSHVFRIPFSMTQSIYHFLLSS